VHERRLCAPVRPGYLDRHDADIEEFGNQRLVERRLLVHLPDERPYLTIGKGVHAVAKELFLV
jgi:hypothetical protein